MKLILVQHYVLGLFFVHLLADGHYKDSIKTPCCGLPTEQKLQ